MHIGLDLVKYETLRKTINSCAIYIYKYKVTHSLYSIKSYAIFWQSNVVFVQSSVNTQSQYELLYPVLYLQYVITQSLYDTGYNCSENSIIRMQF